METAKRIVCDPAILGGKPVVRGTRIPVAMVVRRYAAAHCHFETLLADWPNLTHEDLEACLVFAAEGVEHVAAIA